MNTEWRSEPARTQRMSLAMVALLAVAVVARLIGLWRGMSLDELATWEVVQWPWAKLLADSFADGQLPLYVVFMRYWTAFAGPTDWLLRLPSLIAGVWSVYLLFVLTRDSCRPRTAWLAAGLMAIHAGAIASSQAASEHALVTLLTIASSIQLIRLERSRSWKNAVGLGVLSALGLLTSPLYALFMAAQIVYLAWNNGKKIAEQWPVAVAFVIACCAAAPAWAQLQAATVEGQGAAFSAIAALVAGTQSPLGASEYDISSDVWRWSFFFLMLPATVIGRAFRRRHQQESKASDDHRAVTFTRYVSCWFCVYFLALAIANAFVRGAIHFPLTSSPAAGAICLGLALCVIMQSTSKWPQLALWVVGIAVLLFTIRLWLYPGDGLREGFLYIEERRNRNAERVIGCHDEGTAAAYRFYEASHQGLGFVGLSRDEKDRERIKQMFEKYALSGRDLWLLIHDKGDSHVVEVAKEAPLFSVVEEQTFRDATVIRLRRAGEIADPSQAKIGAQEKPKPKLGKGLFRGLFPSAKGDAQKK